MNKFRHCKQYYYRIIIGHIHCTLHANTIKVAPMIFFSVSFPPVPFVAIRYFIDDSGNDRHFSPSPLRSTRERRHETYIHIYAYILCYSAVIYKKRLQIYIYIYILSIFFLPSFLSFSLLHPSSVVIDKLFSAPEENRLRIDRRRDAVPTAGRGGRNETGKLK